jgi:hypothetical protein
MADDHDLFEGGAVAGRPVDATQSVAGVGTAAKVYPPPVAQNQDFKAKLRAAVDEHFPAMDADGVEAHQPMRDFCLKVLDIL